MNKKQEIVDKMKRNEKFYCISIDKNNKLSSPVFGGKGPTFGVVTIYRDSIEELLESIDNYIYKEKKYGSPFGNQTCEWS